MAWAMARLDSTPSGDIMARMIGDVDVLSVGVREFTVVLEHGRIREQGAHAELSAVNGLYARLYRAQRLATQGSIPEGDKR